MSSLEQVMKKLSQPLDASNISWRVQSIVGGGKYAILLGYKDARVDMMRLDEATGGSWQNKYERDEKGVLRCGIAIKTDGEWIWKWSNGVESQTEQEKGEYSDAFKRAGFMWGIGRELYELPTMFVSLKPEEVDAVGGGKFKQTSKLRVNDWSWEVEYDGGFKKITAKQDNTIRYSYGK
jgi:hypothetical protein